MNRTAWSDARETPTYIRAPRGNAHNLRDVGVAGSNPVTPTIVFKAYFSV